MAGSVNKVILVGNLGKDPEVRNTQSGSKIVSMTLATSESWNDRQSGERRERTEWHRVVIFNDRLGEVAERLLTKGRKVYIEGQLQTRKWTDQSGQERYTTEIVLPRFGGELTILDSKRNDEDTSSDRGTQDRAPHSSRPSAPAGGGWPASGGELDDEIPFAPCVD